MSLVNMQPWLHRQYVCIPCHMREKTAVAAKTTVFHLCPPARHLWTEPPTPDECDYDGWKWMVPLVHMSNTTSDRSSGVDPSDDYIQFVSIPPNKRSSQRQQSRHSNAKIAKTAVAAVEIYCPFGDTLWTVVGATDEERIANKKLPEDKVFILAPGQVQNDSNDRVNVLSRLIFGRKSLLLLIFLPCDAFGEQVNFGKS